MEKISLRPDELALWGKWNNGFAGRSSEAPALKQDIFAPPFKGQFVRVHHAHSRHIAYLYLL